MVGLEVYLTLGLCHMMIVTGKASYSSLRILKKQAFVVWHNALKSIQIMQVSKIILVSFLLLSCKQ